MSPAALAVDAIACVSPVTDAAVISPLKRVSVVTCAVAPARACSPLVADTLVVTELAVTTEPSAGYENASSKATASGGAVATRVLTAAWPGTMTLIAQARAVAPAERSAEPSDAPIVSTISDAAASNGRMVLHTGLLHYSRQARRLLLQTLAGEREEAPAGPVLPPRGVGVRGLWGGGGALRPRPGPPGGGPPG